MDQKYFIYFKSSVSQYECIQENNLNWTIWILSTYKYYL